MSWNWKFYFLIFLIEAVSVALAILLHVGLWAALRKGGLEWRLRHRPFALGVFWGLSHLLASFLPYGPWSPSVLKVLAFPLNVWPPPFSLFLPAATGGMIGDALAIGWILLRQSVGARDARTRDKIS